MTRRLLYALAAIALAPVPGTAIAATEITDAALPAYCAYERQSLEITRESQRRFTDINKADAWADAEVEKLAKALEAETGASFFALLTHAASNRWKLKCNAMLAGSTTLDASAVAAVTRSDARTAKAALERYYVFRMNSANHPLFDRSKFNAIRCDWDTVGGTRFVGCQAMGVSARDLMGVYAVGRGSNGTVMVAPINGTAMMHIKGVPHLTNGETKLPVAAYVGPEVDIPSVLEELE